MHFASNLRRKIYFVKSERTEPMRFFNCDVLVIGTGGAGSRAALEARRQGADVILIAKGPMGRCELTAMTMPGFGALLPSNPRDSSDNYMADTLDGGAYLNDANLVHTLAQGSAEAIDFLEKLGVRFDRQDDGTFMFYSGVEHTKTATPRQLGVDDCMGRAFYNVLVGEIGRTGIRLFEDTFALSLLVTEDRIHGLFALDIRSGRPMVIWARSVVLATGGLVGLYNVRTGHPRDTGDGHALALRAGVGLKDIEFVQSNPAALFHPESVRGVVVPGWYLVMDRGAKYYNGLGEEFLHLHDPERRENTTRDVKARAMHGEILAGRASEHGGIYLDFTKVDLETSLAEYLSEKAPFLLDYLQRIGLPAETIFGAPMEVGPAAHYSCGGVVINERCETSVKGLYAAGEVTGGVHGANRLGNNAMTDIFVFGRIAGEQAATTALAAPNAELPFSVLRQVEELKNRLEDISERLPREPVSTASLRRDVEQVMSENVGFGRDENSLRAAYERLTEFQADRLPRTIRGPGSRAYNYELVEIFELENMLEIGRALTSAALRRTETRGCHNRLDYPFLQDEHWRIHLVVKMNGADFNVEETSVVASGWGETPT